MKIVKKDEGEKISQNTRELLALLTDLVNSKYPPIYTDQYKLDAVAAL